MRDIREIEKTKKNILAFMARNCYFTSKMSDMTLSSGLISNEYIECEPLFSRPGLLESIVSILPIDSSSSVVGGPASGAIPLVIASSMLKGGIDYWFYCDKNGEVKGYKPNKLDKVTVLEDVTTTGQSVLKIIEACHVKKINILEVITLVDREQGAKEAIEEQHPNVWFKSLFTLYDVRKAARQIDRGVL